MASPYAPQIRPKARSSKPASFTGRDETIARPLANIVLAPINTFQVSQPLTR